MKIKITLLAGIFLSLLLLAAPMRATGTNYTLSVTVQGSGTISTNPTFALYRSGVTVTLAATPNTGWYFADWSGDAGGTTNEVNVVMSGDLSVTGLFLPYPTYSLTLATNGQGSIALSPTGGIYYSNTMVTATATPAAGWLFSGWSGATNGNTNPVVLTLDTSLALTGTFVEPPAFDIEPQGVTNVTGSTVSFTSHAVGTPPVAYQWYFGASSLSGATNATLTLTNATALKAGFYQVTATNFDGSATSSVAALVLTNASESTNVVSVCDEADLRAAISAGGWISIGCSGTITLSGTINVTQNVVLDGTGVSAIISGGNAVQLFYVEPGVTLSLTNLTLANGSSVVTSGSATAAGGAIYNNGGTVTLTDCTLNSNTAQAMVNGGVAQGGAIYNTGGDLSLYGTGISNNSVVGGAFVNAGPMGPIGGSGCGGAIFSTGGTVTIDNCVLEGNQCTGEGGDGGMFGGAFYQDSGSLVVSNSLWSTNVALGGNAIFFGIGNQYISASDPAYGGAVAAAGGTVAINLCRFAGNMAQGGNGGLSDPSPLASGGAVYSAASLWVWQTTFAGNQALSGNSVITAVSASQDMTGNGGAIFNLGTAVLDDSCLFSNAAAGASASVYRTTVENGGDGLGGGIFNAGQFFATNCTISRNTSENGGGATLYGPGTNGNAFGGGVCNAGSGTFMGVNVTIAQNFASSKGLAPVASRRDRKSPTPTVPCNCSIPCSLMAGLRAMPMVSLPILATTSVPMARPTLEAAPAIISPIRFLARWPIMAAPP